jgi:DNA-binding GntR family transcriptional regulator
METATDELRRDGVASRERSDVERVYQLIRDGMISAELPPGAFLSEPDLAERCGTSRTPVREALSRLAQDGWVDSIHRKGFQVRPITLRDTTELFAYRRLFERYAAERAAAAATPAQIAAIECILDVEERPNNSAMQLAQLNERFHMALVDRTENHRMIGQMGLIMAFMRRLNYLVSAGDQISHRQILEAVKARDGARAAFLIGEHIDFALSVMIRSFCQ